MNIKATGLKNQAKKGQKNQENKDSEEIIGEEVLKMVLNAAASVIQRRFRKHLEKLRD